MPKWCVVPGCLYERREGNPYCSDYHAAFDSPDHVFAAEKCFFLLNNVWGPPWNYTDNIASTEYSRGDVEEEIRAIERGASPEVDCSHNNQNIQEISPQIKENEPTKQSPLNGTLEVDKSLQSSSTLLVSDLPLYVSGDTFVNSDTTTIVSRPPPSIDTNSIEHISTMKNNVCEEIKEYSLDDLFVNDSPINLPPQHTGKVFLSPKDMNARKQYVDRSPSNDVRNNNSIRSISYGREYKRGQLEIFRLSKTNKSYKKAKQLKLDQMFTYQSRK
jgi:hypothetical protein